MFSSFKFPTLRSKHQKPNQEGLAPCEKLNILKGKPPKTPILGSSERTKRHQRRRSEPGLLPTIAGFKKESAAHDADRFAPGDRISSINGIATARLTNDEVLALLDNVEERASLEVEYYLPNYDSQSSLCITTKVAQVNVQKVNGSLGITLRGGEARGLQGCGLGTVQGAGPLLVTHVRPGGPAHSTARIKSGDRLLKVDNTSLANKSLTDTHQILQNSPLNTLLTIEYDISVMESVKFATGPLLIEIERKCNENLGLILTNKSFNEECFGSQHSDASPGVYIESIIPASISDRCGALHPGDQVLAVDDLLIENSSYTPEDVMCYMENYSNKGFTQLQIYPVHMLLKNLRLSNHRNQPSSPMSGMSTINSRKSHRQNRQFRQSSLPKTFDDTEFHHNNFVTGVGVCRTEVLSLQLDIPPNHDSGITVCEDRELLLISHITHQSPAYRTGCLQLGDRVLSINSQQNLTTQAANEILQKTNDSTTTRYLNVKIEFSMADSVEASSGVFNVKLAKSGAGLGITITGSKQRGINSDEPMVISNIKIGSVAYRSGTLSVGDHLIAIDSQPLSNLSLEAAFSILQNFPDDIITLTVKKTGRDWCDLGAKKLIYPSNYQYNRADSSINSSIKSSSTYAPSNSTKFIMENQEGSSSQSNIFDLQLMKPKDGTLGLTISGSEDSSEPIKITGLAKGSPAERSGVLKVGDEILFINGESVQQKTLSEVINMLQFAKKQVFLKMYRERDEVQLENGECTSEGNNPQSSPGLASVDSAVESWDSQPTLNKRDANTQGKVPDINENTRNNSSEVENRLSYLPTDENKLLASVIKCLENASIPDNQLPPPNFNYINTPRSFNLNDRNGNNAFAQTDGNATTRADVHVMNNSDDYRIDNNGLEHSDMNNPQRDPFQYPNIRDNLCAEYLFNEDSGHYGEEACGITNMLPYQLPNGYQHNEPDFLNTLYAMDNDHLDPSTIHHVTLYKDVVYDDYGFSLSDGLFNRGVFVNRIRRGGPADIVGRIKPFDRILQVNGTRTVDFDCCLTVPLIASAGDRIELVLQRENVQNMGYPGNNNLITKSI